MLLLFFFTDTATTEIYTLSLHDALPIYSRASRRAIAYLAAMSRRLRATCPSSRLAPMDDAARSEEHTSELQSRRDLVCRLLLEKKKKHATRAPIAVC